MSRKRIAMGMALLFVSAGLLAACLNQQPAGAGAQTNFRQVSIQNDLTVGDAMTVGGLVTLSGDTTIGLLSIEAPTTGLTATPAAVIQAKGLGNALEVQNAAGTPVMQVNAAGNITYSGFTSAGGLSSNAGAFAAPTAVGTATPALYVDNAGVSNLFEVRKVGTPVLQVLSDGSMSATGAWSSGQTNNNWVKVSAPTTVATATPAMVIDSTAAGSALLEIRDSATPVARFTNGGGFMFTGLLTGTAGGAVTVTNGAPFAITAAFQPITAAGPVTPTLTIPAAGVYACLYNTSANAIVIQDTGNQVFVSDWTAGQYDFLCGYSDGTRFIELNRANN